VPDFTGAPERIRTADPQIRRLRPVVENPTDFCKPDAIGTLRRQRVRPSFANRQGEGRTNPRISEALARYVYLIKRSDGRIKVGVSKNVRNRRSTLAHASPEKLSIVTTIKPGKGLAFHIESAIKVLLRSFRVRGEWFNCSEPVAMLALRAAEHGSLEDRACITMEIERQRLVEEYTDSRTDSWKPHCIEMLKRFPDFMREVDPWAEVLVEKSNSFAPTQISKATHRTANTPP
jgi:predicted GIY-YIG superfamily endonuclease